MRDNLTIPILFFQLHKRDYGHLYTPVLTPHVKKIAAITIKSSQIIRSSSSILRFFSTRVVGAVGTSVSVLAVDFPHTEQNLSF